MRRTKYNSSSRDEINEKNSRKTLGQIIKQTPRLKNN
jgi:hypothetical protein